VYRCRPLLVSRRPARVLWVWASIGSEGIRAKEFSVCSKDRNFKKKFYTNHSCFFKENIGTTKCLRSQFPNRF
jgi:hypothetical protein